MNLEYIYGLATSDTRFYRVVHGALIKVLVRVVLQETNETPNHANRLAFAKANSNNQGNLRSFATWVSLALACDDEFIAMLGEGKTSEEASDELVFASVSGLLDTLIAFVGAPAEQE